MHFFAILAILSIWVVAFPLTLDQPALTQTIGRSIVEQKLSNTSIPAVSKPDDPYEPGEGDDDHPDRNIPLEEDIAWYNDVYYMNQIPRRVMINSLGTTNTGLQFHQYELWATLRIAGSIWRNYQQALQNGEEDPRPGRSGNYFPRPVNRRSCPMRMVPIGEFDWSDTILEFPLMSEGGVFGEHETSGRIENFIMFAFRDDSLDHPVYVGTTSRVGHANNRHWCPEVHFDGTPTDQQAPQGDWPLSGYDRYIQYIIPLLFLRSWNPANPFDKHRRFPRALDVDSAEEGFAPGTVWPVDNLTLPNQEE